MLLLFLMYTVMVCKAASQTFNYTASPVIVSDKVMTVVMVKDTWFGAVRYCRDNRLGHLLQGRSDGKIYTYIRHQLFLDGWNNTDFLWTGMAKPSSSSKFYRTISCTLMPGVHADNTTTEEQQCLAVNMTSDNKAIDWLATFCGNKYNFVCVKQKDEAEDKNLTNYVITHIYPDTHVIITSTPNVSLTECLERCSTVINRFASVYDVRGSECQHYTMHVHYMPVDVVLQTATSPTINNVVCVKNLSIAIEYHFPDSGYSVTEASTEYVPCTASETTTGSPTETTINTVSATTLSSPAETTISTASETTLSSPAETTISTASETTMSSAAETTISTVSETTTSAATETTISTASKTTMSSPSETTISSETSQGTTIGTTDGTTRSQTEETTMRVLEPRGCDENASQICLCGEQWQISAEELLLRLKLLKEDLTVEKTSLSSYKRKRFSVPDSRTSAQVIGVAGALLIAGVILTIIILDLQYLIKFADRLKAKF